MQDSQKDTFRDQTLQLAHATRMIQHFNRANGKFCQASSVSYLMIARSAHDKKSHELDEPAGGNSHAGTSQGWIKLG